MQHYRITLADSVYYTLDDLADAQSEALDLARRATRAVGESVRVTVHRMGVPVRDELGRDVTPAFLVGSALGRIERSNAFVSWVGMPHGGRPIRRAVDGPSDGAFDADVRGRAVSVGDQTHWVVPVRTGQAEPSA